MSRLLLILAIVLPIQAVAGVVDMNVVYGSDNLKAGDTLTNTLLSYDLSLGIPIGKRDIYVALNYGSFVSSTKTENEIRYSGKDLGLKLGAFLGRGKWFSTALTYNLKSTVRFEGTEISELRGTSLKAEAGLNHWFSENSAALTFKFYYYAPSLSEQVIEESVTKVSYSRASIGQSLGLLWVF